MELPPPPPPTPRDGPTRARRDGSIMSKAIILARVLNDVYMVIWAHHFSKLLLMRPRM